MTDIREKTDIRKAIKYKVIAVAYPKFQSFELNFLGQ